MTHWTLCKCFIIILLVTEQVIPPSFTKPLVDMQEILGSFVQICCKISGSLPISVEWQKDGTKISSGVKHKLLQQDCSEFRPTHLREKKHRVSMGAPLIFAGFVQLPLGLTVNPIRHRSQAPHSSQSTELSLFCLWVYFGLFYFKNPDPGSTPWPTPSQHVAMNGTNREAWFIV